MTTLSPGSDPFLSGVTIQGDGKIILTGGITPPDRGYPDFAITRYTSDGRLDSGFGVRGKVFTDFGTVVASFSATRTKSGTLIRWRTDFEVHDRAFRLYRGRTARSIGSSRASDSPRAPSMSPQTPPVYGSLSKLATSSNTSMHSRKTSIASSSFAGEESPEAQPRGVGGAKERLPLSCSEVVCGLFVF